MSHQNGDFSDVFVTVPEQLLNLSEYAGRNIVIKNAITVTQPIDLTGYYGEIDFGYKRVTYAGAEGTDILTGTPLSGFVLAFKTGAIISNVDNIYFFNVSGDGTQTLRLDGLVYINTLGVDLGSISNLRTFQFENADVPNLKSGFTIGNIDSLIVERIKSNTKIDNFDEKNFLHVIGLIGKITTDVIKYEKSETVLGAKSDNEFFLKIDEDVYIDDGSIKGVTNGLTQMTLVNPAGLPQEELQNVNFRDNSAGRDSGNHISATGGVGLLTNFLQSAKYHLDTSAYVFDDTTTKKESIHLVNSCGCLIFEKDLQKTNRLEATIFASGSQFLAEFYLATLDTSKHWRPVFVDYTTNEIIVRTNLLAVNDKIYFIEGDVENDQLPTGIVENTLYYVKTLDTATRIITISATQGGAEIDYDNDTVGNSLITKLENEITFDNTDNTVYKAAHGYIEGEAILRLDKLVGSVNPTGITDNLWRSLVYVRNPTTDKFQISYTPASAVLTFTTDGTGNFFLRKVRNIRTTQKDLTVAGKDISISGSFDVKNGIMAELYASNIGGGGNITINSVRFEVS